MVESWRGGGSRKEKPGRERRRGEEEECTIQNNELASQEPTGEELSRKKRNSVKGCSMILSYRRFIAQVPVEITQKIQQIIQITYTL